MPAEVPALDLETLPLPRNWHAYVRGWSKVATARHFFVTDDTVRAWLRRIDDESLVQMQTPVNRFPDFIRYRRLVHGLT